MKLKNVIPEIISDFNKLCGSTIVCEIDQNLLPSVVTTPEEIKLDGLSIVVMGADALTYFIVKSEDDVSIIEAKFSINGSLRHYFVIRIIERFRIESSTLALDKINISSVYGEMKNPNGGKRETNNPSYNPYSVDALIRENCPQVFERMERDVYEEMVQKNPIERLEEAIRKDEYRDRYSLDGIMENSGSVAEALASIRNKVDERRY